MLQYKLESISDQ